MIWYYLLKLVHLLVLLFGKPQSALLAYISPNTPCPICGNAQGKLMAVEGRATGADGRPANATHCLHTCDICGARWLEKPVVMSDKIIPAAGSRNLAFDVTYLNRAVTVAGQKPQALEPQKNSKEISA